MKCVLKVIGSIYLVSGQVSIPSLSLAHKSDYNNMLILSLNVMKVFGESTLSWKEIKTII